MIKKIPPSRKGCHHNNNSKELLRRINLGKKLSDKTKLKIQLSMTGKHHSDKTKKRLSVLMKGRSP